MEEIKIESRFADKNGEIMIVELGGHVDQSNSFQLQKMFDDIIDSRVFKVVVDFVALHYMSSAGWGIFVGEVKRFRENGGDIKLAAMSSEINDVYQMLEFFHILDDYSTVEEATSAFNIDGDILNMVEDTLESAEPDLSESQEETETAEQTGDSEAVEVIELIPDSAEKPVEKAPTQSAFSPHAIKSNTKLSDLPISEKIKSIVSENPLVTTWQIKKILKHDHFGNTKIGLFKLMRMLKELDLNTKEKRYRYYRSC